MKCKKCGYELPDGAKFCNKCGGMVEDIEDSSETNLQDDNNMCENAEDKSTNIKPKVKWKDQYTIGIIVAAMIVVGATSFLTSLNKNDSDNQDDYYEEKQITEKYNDESENDNLYDDGLENDDYYEDDYIDESNDDSMIFPNSDSVYLTESDLEGLTQFELRIARNEIYARHGCVYTDETLKNYFESCSWYNPIGVPALEGNDLLNEIEKENAKFIRNFEKKKGYLK